MVDGGSTRINKAQSFLRYSLSILQQSAVSWNVDMYKKQLHGESSKKASQKLRLKLSFDS